MASSSWKLDSIMKEFIPQNPVLLPYICYFIAVTIFLSMIWILLSFIVIIIKLGLDLNLFKRNLPLKKSATLNVRIVNELPKVDIHNPNDIEMKQNNESETVDGTENKDMEAGKIDTEDQVQSDTDVESSEPSNSSAPKPPIAKPKRKNSVDPEDIYVLMNMVTFMQKMFLILIIFLILSIVAHVNLLMIDKVLESYDAATTAAHKDKIDVTENIAKSSDCDYVKEATHMGPSAFSVEDGKITGFGSDEVFEQSNPGNGPFDKGSKSTIRTSVIT